MDPVPSADPVPTTAAVRGPGEVMDGVGAGAVGWDSESG
jgi:hypothetical protein